MMAWPKGSLACFPAFEMEFTLEAGAHAALRSNACSLLCVVMTRLQVLAGMKGKSKNTTFPSSI